MKTYDFTEKNDDNVATYYICEDGDIHDTQQAADITRCVAKVKVHGFFVGGPGDMKRHAHELYKADNH